MHQDFVATFYPQVHKSLKHTTEEHVLIENPPSSTRTLSSMKNLEDTFTFGDQLLNDKPIDPEEEPRKANVETEVESMVTVPIHQASSLVPPLSTLIIDLTPPKPVSPPAQEPIFTATTATTTTTLPLPPPPRQQSTTDPGLANHVFALEKRSADFEEIHQLQDKTTKALASRFYNLENHDLYSKIDKQVNEMFESGSYRSRPDHAALYEALEVSVQRENDDELHETLAQTRKRRRDDQDPPLPPPKDSNRSKKKRQDSDASASKQPPPVDDVPIPDDVYLSDSEDAGAAHLLKIKTRPDWLKPLPEEEALKTPKPDWVIPLIDLPETENNWADALAKTYKDPKEYKLLWKTRDMGSFIKWYCKQIGKSKLVKADSEGLAYKLVKPFHKNSISLQFQMEECHLLLTDQINLMNPEGNRVMHDISKPLPLGGPPGQVTIQTQYFFNKDLEYLVSCDKERRNALSISKLKAANYPDFELKELVLADYKEYKISETNFKNLHPNDFEDMYLLYLQGKLNHSSGADKVHLFNAVNLWIRNIVIRQRVEELQLGIESYQTKLNLTQPRWDATDFLFKEYYTIVHKPRAVIYKDRNNQKKMMRETEVHKFSDCTLTRILKKLDFMVKDYKLFKFNAGIEHRIWFEDDKRRSLEFIKLIERRVKIRRIFRSLESFVSGR
ncbi:hypothetical protein Tco_1220788 [Tanacetum coccineum]